MPYLIFDGTAAEAIAFYCEAFGAAELPEMVIEVQTPTKKDQVPHG